MREDADYPDYETKTPAMGVFVFRVPAGFVAGAQQGMSNGMTPTDHPMVSFQGIPRFIPSFPIPIAPASLLREAAKKRMVWILHCFRRTRTR